MVVVPVRKSVVVVVSVLTVSSTSLVKPANRRRGSLRNGVRSCSSLGDSAAYEERGTWKYEERSIDNIIRSLHKGSNIYRDWQKSMHQVP